MSGRLAGEQARGRAARSTAPRTSLGVAAPRPGGFDVVGFLQHCDLGREVDLLPIRYQRMVADPFSFFRGTAALQAADLARGTSSGVEVQLAGDAHLANFGVFASPERRLVFDVNDFDETAVGPFDWDVRRLAASAVVAARALGVSSHGAERVARGAVTSYRDAIRDFATMRTLDVWYSALDLDEVFADLRGFFSDERSARVRDIFDAIKDPPNAVRFERLAQFGASGPEIVSAPPLLVPLRELEPSHDGGSLRRLLDQAVSEYRHSLSIAPRALVGRFRPVDAARKVVGVGSVGTRCFAVLLIGVDDRDLFFLQVKEADLSAIDRALGRPGATSPGERVVNGQRLLQATPDPFLGFHELTFPDGVARSFYFRQLYDRKAGIDVARLSPKSLGAYASVCGWVLARAHARGGGAAAIAGYVGSGPSFIEAITAYAVAYADQVEADHAALHAAIDQGRVTAAP